MSKVILSARITEKFFTPREISIIKKEMKLCNKSDFIRKIIKYYLNNTYLSEKEIENNYNINYNILYEIKEKIEENQKLLKQFNNNYQKINHTYTGKEQIEQTNKVLDLLNQF